MFVVLTMENSHALTPPAGQQGNNHTFVPLRFVSGRYEGHQEYQFIFELIIETI